jgi:putative transposase
VSYAERGDAVRLINLNPVRARLVEEPAAYRWSGHRTYVGQAQVSWLTTDWVLSHLAGTERVARRRYAAFIAAGQGEGYREEFHRGTAEGRLLGDEDFVAKTLSQVRERSPLRVEPERIIEVVCAHRRIEAGQLATADRSRAGSEARILSAYLAVELGAASLTSMGQRFNRDVATMSNRVRQFRRRLAEDEALAEEIRMLQSELIDKESPAPL